MGRCKENVNCAKKRGYKFTKKQLAKWNLKYSKLIFENPLTIYTLTINQFF